MSGKGVNMRDSRYGRVLGLFLLLLAVRWAVGDDTTSYQMMPSSYGGPEAAMCSSYLYNWCSSKVLKCPKQCPSRSYAGPGKSACFIDCSSKCQATCKHRKPRCWGYGAVCYDPRFVGGDGVMFYFHGQANKDFCLVSDKNLHINAHFIGKRPEGRTRDYTWVKALGIMFDSHKFTVAVKKVSTWNDQFDQLLFSHDGVPITVEAKQLASWTSDNGEVRIERVAATNNVEIVIDRVMAVSLSVKPITEKESKIHKYQITADDCFAHLDIQFKFFNLSSSVDGVLGQTYRPNFNNPVKAGVPMPIMGGEDKYLSSTLLSSDCKSSQFTPSQSDSSNVEYIQMSTAECSTRNGLSGIFCRR